MQLMNWSMMESLCNLWHYTRSRLLSNQVCTLRWGLPTTLSGWSKLTWVKDIIKKQIEQHANYSLKTEYSKEKYKKRKEAKYDSLDGSMQGRTVDKDAGIPSCSQQSNQRYSMCPSTGSTKIKIEFAIFEPTLCHRWWIWPISNQAGDLLPLMMHLACLFLASWSDLEVQMPTFYVVCISHSKTRRGSADHSLWCRLSSCLSRRNTYEFQEGDRFSCYVFAKLVHRSRGLRSQCASAIHHDTCFLQHLLVVIPSDSVGQVKTEKQKARHIKRKVVADGVMSTREELFAGEFDG